MALLNIGTPPQVCVQKVQATMALSGKGEEGEGRGGKGSEGKGQGGENDGSKNNRNVDFAIL